MGFKINKKTSCSKTMLWLGRTCQETVDKENVQLSTPGNGSDQTICYECAISSSIVDHLPFCSLIVLGGLSTHHNLHFFQFRKNLKFDDLHPLESKLQPFCLLKGSGLGVSKRKDVSSKIFSHFECPALHHGQWVPPAPLDWYLLTLSEPKTRKTKFPA